MSISQIATKGVTPALLGLVWSGMFGFSAFFFSYSTMVTIGGLQGLSSVTAGTVLTAMMIGVIAAQPFAPWAGRVLGLRGALLLALGLQLLGQIVGLLALAPLVTLVVGGLCGGVGFGLFVVLANAAVPETVAPTRIGRALGLFGGITSLAAAIAAPLGLWLVESVPVWVFRTVVCVTLLLAVPTVLKFLPGRAAMQQGEVDPAAGVRAAAGRPTGRPRRSIAETLSLIVMFLPFLIGMMTFGLIVGFGPGENVAGAAIFIASMQLSAVVGRLVAGNIADRVPPFALNLAGIGIVVVGLVLTSIAGGTFLFIVMAIVGLGLGTMQSASLVAAFTVVSTPARASVAWNMNFDIGLAIAGVLGGVGFTYLGDTGTFVLCAALLLVAGMLSCIVRLLRPQD
ncbi:MFS transporter [Brevibacterium sp.]|uniref:MFS transporter n=1 Tax=Brevibacterium sp. TaxID=1701 RepID=UPI0028115A6D|nr:MFS transporter [Brevibacterium sp.]